MLIACLPPCSRTSGSIPRASPTAASSSGSHVTRQVPCSCPSPAVLPHASAHTHVHSQHACNTWAWTRVAKWCPSSGAGVLMRAQERESGNQPDSASLARSITSCAPAQMAASTNPSLVSAVIPDTSNCPSFLNLNPTDPVHEFRYGLILVLHCRHAIHHACVHVNAAQR